MIDCNCLPLLERLAKLVGRPQVAEFMQRHNPRAISDEEHFHRPLVALEFDTPVSDEAIYDATLAYAHAFRELQLKDHKHWNECDVATRLYIASYCMSQVKKKGNAGLINEYVPLLACIDTLWLDAVSSAGWSLSTATYLENIASYHNQPKVCHFAIGLLLLSRSAANIKLFTDAATAECKAMEGAGLVMLDTFYDLNAVNMSVKLIADVILPAMQQIEKLVEASREPPIWLKSVLEKRE